MADDDKKSVKAGRVKGIKSNPLTAEQEKYLESQLPEMYDLTMAGDFIKPLENKDTKGEAKLKAHEDTNKKVIVGWGTQAPDLKVGDVITKDSAQARLNDKLKEAVDSIKRNGGEAAWNQMSEDEKSSLLSTIHNVGASGVIFSKKPGEKGQYTEFWKAILAGDKEKAAQENDFGKLAGHKERRFKENVKAGRIKLKKSVIPDDITGDE